MQSLLNWLIGEAGAAWIIGILGFAFGIFQWLRGRERPSRVVVEQILETTLSAPKGVPEPVRVKLYYGDQPIDMLWMTELRIRNVGPTVISEPDLYIQVDSDTKLLGVQLEDVPPSSELEGTASVLKDNMLVVAYPYLNPFHEHKQETTIKVLCDRKPESLTVEGGGKGWSIAFLSSALKERVERPAKLVRLCISAVMFLFGVAALVAFLMGYRDLIRYSVRPLTPLIFLTLLLLTEPILKWWLLRSFR